MRLTEDPPPLLRHLRALIVPAVSAANVPQLAIDLFMHTHNLVRFATIVDPAVLPAVGADALGTQHQMSSSCELFADETGTIALLQLRAPLAPGAGPAFTRRVYDWARRTGGESGACVIWLHSSLADEIGSSSRGGAADSALEVATAGNPPSDGALNTALRDLAWPQLASDDPRLEDGQSVRGILDCAEEVAESAQSGSNGTLGVAVLSVSVAEWSAVADALKLATGLRSLLARLLAPSDAHSTLLASKEWRQPPTWLGLLL